MLLAVKGGLCYRNSECPSLSSRHPCTVHSAFLQGPSPFMIVKISPAPAPGKKFPSRFRCLVTAKADSFRVLVTGSTKGIGRALAEEFVRSGDSVVITSRSGDRVQSTVKQLSTLKCGAAQIKGMACNVSKSTEVAALAKFAQTELGGLDIWINNAGTNGYKYDTLFNLEDRDIVNIVETNTLGVMLCCREAIRVMQTQQTVGHIFNMDGAGADGSATPRFAAYGATKRGLAQFSKSLQAELKMGGLDNICVHNLSPGMVTTELLMSGGDTSTAKFFINCLAETPESVAEFLVPRVRQVASQQCSPGSAKSTYIKFLTKPKAYGQILSRALLGSRKSRFLEE